MRFNAPRHSFQQQQTPVAEKIKATVKWFDPNKGFGFVAPEDRSPDAFLPASAVTAVGHDRLPEGTTVVVDLVQSQKGNQVAQIYDVDVSTASPRPRRDDAAAPRPARRCRSSRRLWQRPFFRHFFQQLRRWW